ncbi:MAG: prepilin-type N-terminal cleavage/methylation domain-containing protein [bacterium]
MLKSKLNQLREKDGFTIIEVIIVLVIAAIIMLAVFLVVPQLQRSQRNTRNQAVARQAFAAGEQFAANNNGTYPSTLTNITDITGTLNNASNQVYGLETPASATPSITGMTIVSDVVACTSSSSAGNVTTTGKGKFKIVVSQETSASATGGVFCISN